MQSRTLKKLLSDLKDRRVIKRRTAAEKLGQADERAVYPLLEALCDENTGVQDAAMRSLIAIGGKTTAYMVLPLLREESFLRNTALIILKDIGPVTVPLLRSLTLDKDDDVRKFILDLVVDINHCDFLDLVARMLGEDSNANVRASAAKALGHFSFLPAIPLLMEALHDEEWVAFSALEALAVMREETTLPAIAQLLSSPQISLRYAAIEALGQMGFPAAGQYLGDRFSQAEGIEKAAILRSLLQLGETPTFPGTESMLLKMFKESDWEERFIYLQGMARLQMTEAVNPVLDEAGSLDPANPREADLIDLVKSELKKFATPPTLTEMVKNQGARFRARTLAIELIEELDFREVIPELIKLLGTSARDVKRASMETICQLAVDNAEETIIEALDDEDGHVRRFAVCALRRIGDKTLVPPLLNLLWLEPYQDVREEIVKTILTWEPEKASEYFSGFGVEIKRIVAGVSDDLKILTDLAGDDSLEVRLAAIGSLGRIDSDQARGKLMEFLKDDHPDMRKAALLALGDSGIAVNLVKPLLADPDLWVRVFAVRVLGRSRKQEAAGLISPLLAKPEIPLVLASIDALVELADTGAVDISALIKPLLSHKVSAIKAKARQVAGGAA